MNWISVHDRLPEIGKTVLTARNSGAVSLDSRWQRGRFAGWLRERSKDITHWMPIPPIPVKETPALLMPLQYWDMDAHDPKNEDCALYDPETSRIPVFPFLPGLPCTCKRRIDAIPPLEKQ